MTGMWLTHYLLLFNAGDREIVVKHLESMVVVKEQIAVFSTERGVDGSTDLNKVTPMRGWSHAFWIN